MNARSPDKDKFKIVVVDDDPVLVELVSAAVEKLGFEALAASSAEEALLHLQTHFNRTALVVADYQMPVATGFDLRRMMLPQMIDVPFIILSGHVTTTLALDALNLKISNLLPKPFRLEALREIISKECQARVTSLREDEELIGVFVDESRVLLEEMESIALAMEDGARDLDQLNRFFACTHTIKGSSGYFKPTTLNQFTHRFEDYISHFRTPGAPIAPGSVSVILKAIDIIRELLNSLATFQPPQALDELLKLFEVKVENVEIGDSSPAALQTKVDTKRDELKVSASLVDDFIECGGELTVLRNMVNKNLRLVEINHPDDASVSTLSMLLNEMYKINIQMQEQMAELRKVSVRNLVKPLARTVRDLASQLKKKIRFEVEGEDLAIEHSVADVLSKCLIHIIRNSADHGLETPVQRIAANKTEVGSIRLSFTKTPESYLISISDDGRGIDSERVMQKAIEQKLATASEIASMSPSRILNFIFEPGFSTAAVVSDVSGRGVGTDMVKKSVEGASGSIEIWSQPGQGSRFDIRLPIPKSVLILNSLLVEADQQIFAIPQTSIRRVALIEDLTDARIQGIGANRVLCTDGLILPLVRLSYLLRDSRIESSSSPALTEAVSEAASETSTKRPIVWVEGKAGAVALEVDTIFDVEDTVVKKVAPWFQRLNLFLGATFLADGRPGLVLDIDGVLSRLGEVEKSVPSPSPGFARETESSQAPRELNVLVFRSGSVYATAQSQLFRLEEFTVESLQTIGDQHALLYRGKAMPVLNFENLVWDPTKRTNWPLIVIERGENLYGIVVESILGFSKWTSFDSSTEDSFPANGSISTLDEHATTYVNIQSWIDEASWVASKQAA